MKVATSLRPTGEKTIDGIVSAVVATQEKIFKMQTSSDYWDSKGTLLV